MGLGQMQGVSNNYVRGTTTLFATLVSFIDQAQIERRCFDQPPETRFAAGVFATGEKHALGGDFHVQVVRLHGGNTEQVVKLVLPLPHQWPRHHDDGSVWRPRRATER